MDDTLQATVETITKEGAVLRLGDQRLIWPRELLPVNTTEGSIVHLHAVNPNQAQTEAERRARQLLSEILGGQG